jgi:hypothetical protein
MLAHTRRAVFPDPTPDNHVPQHVILTDEGLNGLWLHPVNGRAEPRGDPVALLVARRLNGARISYRGG